MLQKKSLIELIQIKAIFNKKHKLQSKLEYQGLGKGDDFLKLDKSTVVLPRLQYVLRQLALIQISPRNGLQGCGVNA